MKLSAPAKSAFGVYVTVVPANTAVPWAAVETPVTVSTSPLASESLPTKSAVVTETAVSSMVVVPSSTVIGDWLRRWITPIAVKKLVIALLMAVNTELISVLTLEMKDSSGLAAASGVANADNVFATPLAVSGLASPGPGCAARCALVTTCRMRPPPNSLRVPANSTDSAGEVGGSPTGEPAADTAACMPPTTRAFDSAATAAGAGESIPACPGASSRGGA
ncbi:hypothetical protein FHT44_001031 [Mycolicibacterium sp. BK634]|nr:hypothetical protein [Mycolicibacterium sp. BK634]